MIIRTRLVLLSLVCLPLVAACQTKPSRPHSNPSDATGPRSAKSNLSPVVTDATCHILYQFRQVNRYYDLESKAGLEQFVATEVGSKLTDQTQPTAARQAPVQRASYTRKTEHRTCSARETADAFLSAYHHPGAPDLVAGDEGEATYVYIGQQVYCNYVFTIDTVAEGQVGDEEALRTPWTCCYTAGIFADHHSKLGLDVEFKIAVIVPLNPGSAGLQSALYLK